VAAGTSASWAGWAAFYFQEATEPVSTRVNDATGTTTVQMGVELSAAADALLIAKANAALLIGRFDYARQCYESDADSIWASCSLGSTVAEACQWWREEYDRVVTTPVTAKLTKVAERLEAAATKAKAAGAAVPMSLPASGPEAGATVAEKVRQALASGNADQLRAALAPLLAVTYNGDGQPPTKGDVEFLQAFHKNLGSDAQQQIGKLLDGKNPDDSTYLKAISDSTTRLTETPMLVHQQPHGNAQGGNLSAHAPVPAAPTKPAPVELPDIKPPSGLKLTTPLPDSATLKPPASMRPEEIPPPAPPPFTRTDVPLPDVAQNKLKLQETTPPQPPPPSNIVEFPIVTTPQEQSVAAVSPPANTSVVEFPIVTAPKDPPILPTVKVENPVPGYVPPPAPLPAPTMPFTADGPPPPPPPPPGAQTEVDNRLVAQAVSSANQPSALNPTVFGSTGGWPDPAPTTAGGGEADRVTVTATDRNRDGTFDYFTTDGAKNVTVKVDGHTV
jgi:hypothetical protein